MSGDKARIDAIKATLQKNKEEIENMFKPMPKPELPEEVKVYLKLE